MAAIGYCTNVHAGRNLKQLRESLFGPVCRVRELLGSDPLPIGLWLSAESVRQLTDEPEQADRLRDDLLDRGVHVAALNAFPYGDFSSAQVKTRVYEPNWANTSRALFTLAAAEILPRLVPPGTTHASISTLPLGWRKSFTTEGCGASVGLAAAQLEQVARALSRLEQRTGVCVTLDIEPEPGCAIQTFQELTDFFSHCLRPRAHERILHRHLGACVDACHAAVMGESPEHIFNLCHAADLGVHRVQLSSALCGTSTAEDLASLQQFDEPRYLHQVVVGSCTEPTGWPDIPDFLASHPMQPWRCHFHVPIFLGQVGSLGTTTANLQPLLDCVARDGGRPFIEVETYAWSQLPHPAASTLEEGLAQEIRHARCLLAKAADSVEPSTR